tara:strand:- start:1229 stop:1330 length:102 start_codon:yes stop_codon:yes gene_type:complete
MDKIISDHEKDYVEVLEELIDKLNEIIDWINSQ